MTRILITISFLLTTLFSSALFAVSGSSASKNATKKHSVSKPKATVPATTQAPQPTGTAPTPAKPVVESDPGITFGLGYSLRYTIQAEQQETTLPTSEVVKSRDEYYTHELIPSVSTKNYKFLAVLDFYDHFKAPQGNSWDPVAFAFTINNPWALTDYFFMKPELAVGLQLFKTETQPDLVNNIPAARMHLILNSKNTIPGLILKYNIQYAKFNLKEEKIADPSKPDGFNYFVDTRLRHRVFLGYMITDSLMPMIFFQFDSNFLHDSTVTNKFYHETFLEYTFNDNFSIDAGVANGGGIYTGEYQDIDNLKFYNKESSEYFLQLNVSI